MGKGGRVACIFAPVALTIAAFVCIVLIQVAGWSPSTLSNYYFFEADFTDLDVSAATAADSTTLSLALNQITSASGLADIYRTHLWNYCYTNDSSSSTKMEDCTDREAGFYFDPVDAWDLNSTLVSANIGGVDTGSSALNALEEAVRSNTNDLTESVFGDSVTEALKVYRRVAKWLFIAYAVSFFASLATLVFTAFAVCSRWGSLLTWILSSVASVFTLAASITSTVLFAALSNALSALLSDYNVSIHLGHRLLVTTWLATLFSLAATLFWLFSTCCCSGKNNPHHRSQKGGLWTAEPKGLGYDTPHDTAYSHGYEKPSEHARGDADGEAATYYSPNAGHGPSSAGVSPGYAPLESRYAAGGGDDDRVPLTQYPQTAGYTPAHASPAPSPGGLGKKGRMWEPRHS